MNIKIMVTQLLKEGEGILMLSPADANEYKKKDFEKEKLKNAKYDFCSPNCDLDPFNDCNECMKK